MAMSKFSKSSASLPPSVHKNPSLNLILKKMDKVDGPDAGKYDWIKLEFLMDPDNPAWGSKYSWQLAIFKDGCPKDWIKWVMAFCEIENLMSMKEPDDKTRMLCRAIAKFKHLKNNKACFEAKAVSVKKSLDFLFEEINALKRQLNPEKIQAGKRGRLNSSTLMKFI
jgi:hypothetical protein